MRAGLRRYTMEMRSHALEADRMEDLPAAYIGNSFFLPVWQLGTPEHYGYQGIKGSDGKQYYGESALELAIWTEEIAYADPTMLVSLPGPQLLGPLVRVLGNKEQQERLFASFLGEQPIWASFGLTEPGAGSDAGAIRTTACTNEEGDYHLYGEKKYIGNGTRSSWLALFAKVGDPMKPYAIQCFLLDKSSLTDPGLTRTSLASLGMKAGKLAHICLDGVQVSKEHLLGRHKSPLRRGLHGAVEVFYRMRPCVSALALGTSLAAMDYVEEHLNLDANKQIQTARLRWKLEKNRLLIYRAAQEADQGIYRPRTSSIAKWVANQCVYEVTRFCAQLAGGSLFIDHPLLEKWLRDARMIEFMEGTSNIHKRIIGHEMF
ncbi:MAG: acyl-CoA/acyl-ACP dehydrogenase [Paenibacillus sp.]|nr:acyl-CoA dehydrogenase family protein [Paenibacillus sp.]MDR0267459.1 acyl-CoA/acyl-ACP dehydrogenase [Paenibacillus sp.]